MYRIQQRKRKLTDIDFLRAVESAEKAIACRPDATFGDAVAPLEHIFLPGQYVRKITMPPGLLVTSARHKTTHPFFVLTGMVWVASVEGTVAIRAPYCGVTQAGTKRVLYVVEECVWVTVHATGETDLDKLRKLLTEDNALLEDRS
jgi:hypothetical protein